MDKELVFIIVSILAVLAVVFGGIALASNVYGSYQCAAYERITGKKTMWHTLDICYVQTSDGWQRWDEYTKRAIASEGLKSER